VRIFLSVPFRTNTSVLRQVISAAGSTVVVPDDVAPVLDSPTHWLDSWEGIDAVIAIPTLVDGARSDSVLIETGFALGRGLPVLVLYEDEAPLSGNWPINVTVGRANLANVEALSFHVNLFLARAGRGPSKPPPGKPSSSSHSINLANAHDQLEKIQQVGNFNGYRLFEDWLVDLLEGGGAEVVRASGRDRGFDLVASLPIVAPSLGPIVVELKSFQSASQLEEVAARVQQVVLQERAALGLIILARPALRNRSLPQLPGVSVLTADDLLALIDRRGSLADALLSLRNEVVHRA